MDDCGACNIEREQDEIGEQCAKVPGTVVEIVKKELETSKRCGKTNSKKLGNEGDGMFENNGKKDGIACTSEDVVMSPLGSPIESTDDPSTSIPHEGCNHKVMLHDSDVQAVDTYHTHKADLNADRMCFDEKNTEESNSVCEVENHSAEGLMADEIREGCEEELHSTEGCLYLDELDDDVLLHIASFLDARSVKYAMSRVCVRFQEMFDNEAYWKSRIMKRWPKKYPAVPALPDFNWLDACVEREDSYRVWRDPASNTRHFLYPHNLFAEVDSVHLMKRGQLLLSGDRNRNLNVIDLNKYRDGLDGQEREDNFKEMLVHSDCITHKGWIWSMTSMDNFLLTGSWDSHIRLFDINSQMVPISTYKCKSAVLSLLAEQNEIVASCFDNRVYFIDRRTSEIRFKNFHKQAVLSVTGNDKFIISGSEDKTISVYDRRAEKILRRITLEHYPVSMCFRDNHLWFGDKCGQLHLYDGTQGLFQHVGIYDFGHTDKVTGVISTRGAIFTCSGDKTVKVHTPSHQPDLIASLGIQSKEIARLDFSHGVLTSAGGEDSICVWLPKHWDQNSYLL